MPDTPVPPDRYFHFHQHEHDMYEFIFLEGSRATVDAWMAKVALINQTYQPDGTVRYIVDVSQVDMPVAYTLLQSQDYVRRHPQRPHTRTLVLYRVAAPQVSLLNVFVRWIQGKSREKARFLSATERDAGIAWLLED